ncbi:hypothetical protein [Nocardia crassostreae]|uniref:hypothetical protein n=1 Tax=Nocardia crassostreae TaxID=53428 RepID=UPI00083254CC|nr:hypothetical protein [Nocardia crassostreae]
MADNEPAEQPPGRRSSFTDLSQVVQLVAQFVAPATLLAGLLYYWGYFHARGFCAHLGVDSATLGLTTTDYVMRSADGLFIPVAVFATIALGLAWVRVALPRRYRDGYRPKWLLIGTAAVGGLLLLNGLSQLQFDTPLNRGLGVAPACVIAGLLLLWAAVRARRRELAAGSATPVRTTNPLEWTLVVLLVAGSFFWGATAYSMAVGKGRAIRFEQSIAAAARLTVYSEKALEFNAPGVTGTACTDPGSAYRYRYDGLVLAMTTGHAYVIVPRLWTYRQGTAIVLPRTGTGAVRLEYTRFDPKTPPPSPWC